MRNLLLGAALLVAACASSEPLPPAAAAPPPPMLMAETAPAPPPESDSVASGVTLPSRPAPPAPAARPGDVIVPGTRPVRTPAPNADVRTVAERQRDVRAWDDCVTRAQDMTDSDPTRPQLTTPEEVCSQRLGMASRLASPSHR